MHPLPGLRSWTPHYFGLRTLVGTGLHSTAFLKKKIVLKSSKLYAQFLFNTDEKKLEIKKFMTQKIPITFLKQNFS